MLDLIVFITLAAFVVFKLRKLLGEEYTEVAKNVKDVDGIASDVKGNNNKMNIMNIGNKAKKSQPVVINDNAIIEDIVKIYPDISPELSANMVQLYKMIPGFTCESFKYGAIATFEALLDAYSNDNIIEINSIAKPKVAQSFISIIEKHKLENVAEKVHVAKIKAFDIIKVALGDVDLKVDIKFTSLQITYNINTENSAVISGSKSEQHEAVETWTFVRTKTSQNPEWYVENITIDSVL